VNLLYSKFTNENDLLRWTNPYFGGGTDTSTLPIDNDYIRLGINGALKQLPLARPWPGASPIARPKRPGDTDQRAEYHWRFVQRHQPQRTEL